MATTVARLNAVLSANTRDFDSAMSKSETRMKRVGQAAKVGLAVGVTAGIAVLRSSVKEALEAEKSQARLEQSFKENVKGGIDPWRASIEKASTAAINLGFDDEALKDSLGSLVVATGDYKKAQDLANVAMDIARFKGVDLEQATKMLTMAMAGSQRATKQLGIDVPKTTAEFDRLKEKFTAATSEGGKHITKSEQMRLETAKLEDKQRSAGAVIDTVRQKVKGQADAYRNTAEGSMTVFSAKLEELQEKLGTKLLPRLTQIVTALSTFIDKLEGVDKWMGKVGANQGLLDILKKFDKATEDIIGRDYSLIDFFKDLFKWTNAFAGALKDAEGWIRKIAEGGNKGLIDIIRGDAKDPHFVPPGIRGPIVASISPALADELAGARSFGLALTSGYRPGARTRSGHISDHAHYPSKAIDVAGAPGAMAGFFRWLIGQRDVKQAFYDPLGSIFGGALSSYREGGHSDHVHVATYDKGGWLQPGWNLAYNGLGRPEPVGPATTGDINLYVDGHKLFSWFRDAEAKHQRRNG